MYNGRFAKATLEDSGGNSMRRAILLITGLPILLALSPAPGMASTNLALNLPITPLTNTVMGVTADVTNGSSAAWWSYQGGNYNTCSFTIDLGAPYAISGVALGQWQLFGYALYSSTDGSTWTLQHQQDFVISGNIGINTSQNFTENGYVARYFKYTSYSNWNQYVGVNNFQVFGTAANAAPAAPVPALSAWTLTALALLLFGSGLWVLRARTV
jgi:hypothetical protein